LSHINTSFHSSCKASLERKEGREIEEERRQKERKKKRKKGQERGRGRKKTERKRNEGRGREGRKEDKKNEKEKNEERKMEGEKESGKERPSQCNDMSRLLFSFIRHILVIFRMIERRCLVITSPSYSEGPAFD
jgi:hypothetical protein